MLLRHVRYLAAAVSRLTVRRPLLIQSLFVPGGVPAVTPPAPVETTHRAHRFRLPEADQGSVLRVCCAVCGTEIAYGATRIHGTEITYAATRLRDVRY
eukprot:2664730-Rhodomonas_salina.6